MIPAVMSLFTKDVLSSFIISRGLKSKLTIAQNEQTGPSKGKRSKHDRKMYFIIVNMKNLDHQIRQDQSEQLR